MFFILPSSPPFYQVPLASFVYEAAGLSIGINYGVSGISKVLYFLLCQMISVECPTNFDPGFMLIRCLGLPSFRLVVSSGKFKFVGHSTEIIRQSEIKGPLYQNIRCLIKHIFWFFKAP